MRRRLIATASAALLAFAAAEEASAQTCPSTMMLTQPLRFERAEAVRFGPGTGMSMVGSSTFGLQYNLLFSGNYTARMAGNLNVAWPQALTLTTTGTPAAGFFQMTFGLRMTASLLILGATIPLDLSGVIADMNDTQMRTFDPWNMTPPSDRSMDPTLLHLNVSAWRNLVTRDFMVAGQTVRVTIDMRYNMDTTLETLEIGFPDPTGPTGMEPNLASITGAMPMAMYPPPMNSGHLRLFTRWRARVNYYGTLEFRGQAQVISCPLGICVTIATHNLPMLPIAQSGTQPAAPYDQFPEYDFPIEQIDQTEIDFGEVMLGTTAMNSIDVFNPGTAQLATRLMGMPATGFTVGTTGCVAPNAHGQIPVSFRPTTAGMFSTEVQVLSNGITGSPTRVRLFGIGTTGESRPPLMTDAGRASDASVRLPDGAVVSPDGGSRGEYRGAQVDAGCGCRAPGAAPRSSGAGLLGLLAGAVVLGARRRSRDA